MIANKATKTKSKAKALGLKEKAKVKNFGIPAKVELEQCLK